MNNYSKALHRYAVLVACATFLLMIAGGLVTSTQSGLSVPDWPNTYGHFMFAFPLDQMVGGILYEHSHRMIASVVGFLTVILAFWLWKKDERRWVRVLGFASLGAVIAQGILGGLTVIFLLPTAISVSHATLAQTFFVLTSSLALLTSRWWRNEQKTPVEKEFLISLPKLTIFTTGAIYLQLILGAIMRHLHAGLAIPDFPFSYGQLIPALNSQAISDYNQHLESIGLRVFSDDPVTSVQILFHFLHRFWALIVTILVIWTSIKLRRTTHKDKRLSRLSSLLALLVLIQITLGAFTVLTQKAIDITTAHVATGALLLVVSSLTSLHVIKLFRFSLQRVAISVNAKEVVA